MLRVMHLVGQRPTLFAEVASLDLALDLADSLKETTTGWRNWPYTSELRTREVHKVWLENGLSATRPVPELRVGSEDLATHASCSEVSEHRVRFLARSLSSEQRFNLAAWLRNAARVAEDIVRADELERQKWLDAERLRLNIQAVREHPQEPTPRERRLATKAERTLDVDQLLGEL